MILTYSEAYGQVQNLLKVYPKLKPIESDSEKIRLYGLIEVYRSACNYILQKEYPIEIIIPINSNEFPTVIDKGNMIAQEYPHRYTNGELCLETNTAIKLRFIDGFDLVAWMDEFVEPYFFSYEYYSRYGEFPFGERPHGLEGIVHTYQQLFHADNLQQACSLLVYAAEDNYRGHIQCPCKSGKKLRNCHGPYLFPFMTDPRKKRYCLIRLKLSEKGADCT